ncbi:phage tail tube protein [Pseudoalteromonas sp. NZS100]|uniref:phage tail tube protein n=1 Tax=Pseudoalteromonas sp. NZS100 TaxID=2792046 RepID=UPI0018CFAA53|nr:phage tail tube protein [Pseudoalteromonas sp. NZS100]MBH0066794.1 hypothetical protein [Pseudoalteromonas sp. NZS100]
MTKWSQTSLLAAIEATYGTLPAVLNAMLTKDIELRPLEGEEVERGLNTPYLGAEETMFTNEYAGISFKVELVGSGTLGLAPAWGPLMRACGMAEVIVADTSVEYTPVSDSVESVAMHFQLGRNKHTLLGAQGSYTIELEKGIPYLSFDFKGLYVPPSDNALPAADFSAWPKPIPLGAGRTTDFLLHGFEVVPSKLSIDSGNEVEFDPTLTTEKIEFLDRAMSGSVNIAAPNIADIDFFSRALSSQTGNLQIKHGPAGGHRVTISCPKVQVKQPKYVERNKKAEIEMALAILPSAGNDEFSLLLD